MNATGKWARRAVWVTLLAVLAVGCNPLTLPFVLLRTEAKLPAEYPLRPKDGPKKDKDVELNVLVLVSPIPPGSSLEFAGADRELTRLMAKKLPELAKANKEKIAVISPTRFDNFKMGNPNWQSMRPGEIGRRLGADYVLDITLSGMRMYQPGSMNQIYEGRAEVAVDVYDTAAATGETKHRYVHPYQYPPGYVRDASWIPASQFKMLYLDNLANELSLKHLDHKAGDGVASAK